MFGLVPLARAVVIEAMDAGVMVMDMQDRILDINPAFKSIAGISIPQYYLMPVEEVCKAIPELVRIIKNSSISHADFSIAGGEQSMIFEILLILLNDKNNNCIGRLAMIYDITEKKRAQQEFLKQQWQLAVIDERERMARDLHDNMGQVMGFINFQTQAIRQELVNEGIELVSDKLDQLIKVTQNTHAQIREYISSIRTSVNTERDFITSLKNDITNFEQQTGLPVILDIPDGLAEKEFNSTVMVNIQNIIREAMNNIRKHAHANVVRISFHMDKNQMIVSIVDDGRGFNMIKSDYTVKNKFGLDIMRERAALIGGSVNIESAPNKGSRIMISVPRMGGNETNESNAG
jgi:signal transduction histidine kinase